MRTSAAVRSRMKGDVRRDQILRASFAIIGKKGVSSLTTAAIARKVGMSEANLYRHFGSKHGIILAGVIHVRTMIMANAKKALSGRSAPLTKLKRFFRLQIELMETMNGIPRFMFSEELHIHRTVREKVMQTLQDVSITLAGLIRQGQNQAVLRKDIDAGTTALMFIGMLQGLAFRWSLSGFTFSLSKEGRDLWRNFEKCIVLGRSATG